MSKTFNHHYYNLCTESGEIGPDGYCDFHRPWRRSDGSVWRGHDRCVPPGEFETRRGIVRREPRFPSWSVKSWSGAPPGSVKRIWQRKIRAAYRNAMCRNPDDPDLFDGKKALSELIWNWY